MNLSQDSFQMKPFLIPLLHHTTNHDNIDMVFDMAQRSLHPTQQQSHQGPFALVASGPEHPRPKESCIDVRWCKTI